MDRLHRERKARPIVFDQQGVNLRDALSTFWIEADIELDAATGPGAVGPTVDPEQYAAVLAGISGAALSNAGIYLGAVIAQYALTGTISSTFPRGAVLASIEDGVTEADGAFVAYIDGDSSVTNANAAFKVMTNNSTAASGFAFGLDLQDAAHDGFNAVDDAFYTSAPLRLVRDVVWLAGDAVPTDGTSGTGAGVAGPGSIYSRTNDTNGEVYVNTNTQASPTWVAT